MQRSGNQYGSVQTSDLHCVDEKQMQWMSFLAAITLSDTMQMPTYYFFLTLLLKYEIHFLRLFISIAYYTL